MPRIHTNTQQCRWVKNEILLSLFVRNCSCTRKMYINWMTCRMRLSIHIDNYHQRCYFHLQFNTAWLGKEVKCVRQWCDHYLNVYIAVWTYSRTQCMVEMTSFASFMHNNIARMFMHWTGKFSLFEIKHSHFQLKSKIRYRKQDVHVHARAGKLKSKGRQKCMLHILGWVISNRWRFNIFYSKMNI